ncbi:MAG: RNA polymerase sigma factor [Phycisphaerales bacterium]
MSEDRTTNEPTDEELAEDALHGDDGAFRALIERYHDVLLRFLMRMTGSRETAEDAFQDTFLQIHQSLHTFDFSRSLKPWLFTIAANKARDLMRRAQRRPAASLSRSVGEEGDSPAFVDLLAIDLPGPSDAMEREELSAMVQRAIDTMSPRMREILLMAYFQRLNYQQIAELLEIPLGTVKSRLHAAVASFAKRWEEQMRATRAGRHNAQGSHGAQEAHSDG